MFYLTPPKMHLRILLSFLLLACTALAQDKIKGMAFSTGHNLYGYRQPFAEESMRQLKQTGANYVHISAYVKMQKLNSLSARVVTDTDSIRFIIRKAKRMGFKVFFKPVVEIRGNVWRGFLEGSEPWFNRVYNPFIIRMAKIAQEEGVDLFAVGSEYVRTLDKPQRWRNTIRLVKQHYRGQTTYVANHDSFRKCTFWDAVDFISISGYFKLLPGVRGFSPNLEQTKTLWRKKADMVELWRQNAGLTNKKIIIAEVGFQSKGQGVVYRVPFHWLVKAPVNFNEQVKMYIGFLGAFMPRQWCKGVILWNWELEPNSGTSGRSLGFYTPQNKPALRVMKDFFLRRF